MNNQRNNNRRRGRGNNRGGNGGGNPVNRIDSRARGNAPQLLEKYRKLAHEASLNDDRVQTEYYLQFADHYFRVIADAKAQKDEQQGRPRGDRDADDGEDYLEDDRFDDRSRRPQPQQSRQDRAAPADEDGFEIQRGTEGDEDEGENPFLVQQQARPPREKRERDGRDRDGRREGRDRDDRGREEKGRRRKSEDRAEADDPATFDPGMLPPSISRSPSDEAAGAGADEAPVPVADEEAVRKPRRTRAPRRKADGEGEELEQVG